MTGGGILNAQVARAYGFQTMAPSMVGDGRKPGIGEGVTRWLLAIWRLWRLVGAGGNVW